MKIKVWSEKVWANIGRLSVFVTLLAGVIYIYSFISTPSGKLIAEVEFSNFKWPPEVLQLIENNYYKNSIVPFDSLYYIDGIWFVKVRNAGKIQCSSVTIKLPRAIFASVEREGADLITSNIKGVVNIGNLMPQEAVNIVAWTNGFHSHNEKIQISYDKGLGKVMLKRAVDPFWWLLAKYWWAGVFLTIFIITSIVQIVEIKKK